MILPDVEPEILEDAFRYFDQHLRTTSDWIGWESRLAQKFAVVHGELLYPPKKIISIATGLPVASFSGGRQSNDYFRRRDFKIVAIEHPVEAVEAPQFVIGKIYDRWPEINLLYGGSRQSGISPSSQSPAIFLFTGDSGKQYGYSDAFDEDGVFSYTGEGQVGDMTLTKGNLAIATHTLHGRALHVFESLRKGRGQKYVGEFTYVNHSFQRGPDRNGVDRKVIVFHLVPVGREIEGIFTDEVGEDLIEVQTIDLAEARRRALDAFGANEGAGGRQAKKLLYFRSTAVKNYVLLRSCGKCESCGEPAPFKRADGSPYLEPHHTTRISDGGLDHPRFVGAVCPTCHREIHHGVNGKSRNTALAKRLVEIEPFD